MVGRRRCGLNHTDRGAALIEMVVAFSLLAMVLILTIGPISGAFGSLGRAKHTDVGEAVGEARTEWIRNLDYEEVCTGTPPAAPCSLEDTYDYTVQGILWHVDTVVVEEEEQGGSNIFYKKVLVTVRADDPPNGFEELTFETQIAAPYFQTLALGKEEVRVYLEPFNPFDEPLDALPATIYLYDSRTSSYHSSTPGTDPYTFENLNELLPAVPEEFFLVRLSIDPDPSLSIQTPALPATATWRIHQSDLDSQTEVLLESPLEVREVRLQIYQPAQLDYTIDDGASPIPLASLSVEQDGVYSLLAPEADSSWEIADFRGVPLPPGNYNVQVDAPGYDPYVETGIEVGRNGGSPVAITQSMNVATTFTGNITWQIQDVVPNPIHGALIRIAPDSGAWGPITYVSDPNGTVVTNLPVWDDPLNDDPVTVEVSSHYGHVEPAITGYKVPFGATVVPITMDTPGGSSLVTLTEGENGYFSYVPDGSGANWVTPILANNANVATIAVPNGTYVLRRVCWNGVDPVVEHSQGIVGAWTWDPGPTPCGP